MLCLAYPMFVSGAGFRHLQTGFFKYSEHLKYFAFYRAENTGMLHSNMFSSFYLSFDGRANNTSMQFSLYTSALKYQTVTGISVS